MTNHTPPMTKNIDQTVEEFEGTVWHARLKEHDRTTDDEEELDHPTEMFVAWLRTTIEKVREEAQVECARAQREWHKGGFEDGVAEERNRIREWAKEMHYSGEALASNDTRRGYDSFRAELQAHLNNKD